MKQRKVTRVEYGVVSRNARWLAGAEVWPSKKYAVKARRPGQSIIKLTTTVEKLDAANI